MHKVGRAYIVIKLHDYAIFTLHVSLETVRLSRKH